MTTVFDGRPTGSAGSTTDAPWAGLNWGGSIDGTPTKSTSFNVVNTNRRFPHTHQLLSVNYTVAPTGGTLTLSFDGQTTAALDHDSTAAEVKTALENLSNIAVNDIVTTGGPLPAAPIGITFSGGDKQNSSQPAITATSSLTGGTNVSVGIARSYRPNMMRYRVADGDQYGNSSGERTEHTVYTNNASIAPGVGARHGESVFYCWSMYLPSTSTPSQSGYAHLWQLKHITTNTFSPNYGVQFRGGILDMFANGGAVTDDCTPGVAWDYHSTSDGLSATILGSADVPKDELLDFIVEVRGAYDDTGYFKCWYKPADETELELVLDTSGTPHPNVFRTSPKPSGSCLASHAYTDDHLRQGLYRHANNSNTFEYYTSGLVVFTTRAEAEALLGAPSVTSGGGTPGGGGSADGVLPAAASGKTRVGKATVGATRSGITADRKRGSKYLFPNGTISKSYVHLQSEASSGSQVFKQLIYAEDAAGEPGALIATSDEVTITCPEDPVWQEFTWTDPPEMAANYYWVMLWSGATSQLCKYASSALNGALRFGAETYDSAASDPSPAMSTDAIEISQVVDVTPADGTNPDPADTTAPTVASAEILTNILQIGFNEPLGSNVPATSAFSVTFDGAQQIVSGVSVSGDTVELTISGPHVLHYQTVLVSYTQPGINRIADVAGNAAASFTNQAVTNINESLEGLGRIIGTAGRVVGTAGRIVGGTRVIGSGGGGG